MKFWIIFLILIIGRGCSEAENEGYFFTGTRITSTDQEYISNVRTALEEANVPYEFNNGTIYFKEDVNSIAREVISRIDENVAFSGTRITSDDPEYISSVLTALEKENIPHKFENGIISFKKDVNAIAKKVISKINNKSTSYLYRPFDLKYFEEMLINEGVEYVKRTELERVAIDWWPVSESQAQRIFELRFNNRENMDKSEVNCSSSENSIASNEVSNKSSCNS